MACAVLTFRTKAPQGAFFVRGSLVVVIVVAVVKGWGCIARRISVSGVGSVYWHMSKSERVTSMYRSFPCIS